MAKGKYGIYKGSRMAKGKYGIYKGRQMLSKFNNSRKIEFTLNSPGNIVLLLN